VTIFDYINNILFHKKEIAITNEDNQFSGYLTNRWISMYSPTMALVVNNSTNWLYSIFETDEQYYKFLFTIIPKVRQKYIQYIKKVKTEDTNTDEETEIEILARNLELSKREVKLYLDINN
jgi:hypothetical protein